MADDECMFCGEPSMFFVGTAVLNKITNETFYSATPFMFYDDECNFVISTTDHRYLSSGQCIGCATSDPAERFPEFADMPGEENENQKCSRTTGVL
jgi:hypothetical protein